VLLVMVFVLLVILLFLIIMLLLFLIMDFVDDDGCFLVVFVFVICTRMSYKKAA
jgi:hypothetical protein